jgi:3-deoxy-D-manno-octulosonic-acid transferase
MPLLTDTGTALYGLAVRAAALFHPKAKAWVDGRCGMWERIDAIAPKLHGCLWMHSASVGEFEQGLPILEAIKAERPELPVLLTFQSPSGFEARKDHPLATHVEYLPTDTARNAQRLIDRARPAAVIWVKYEFWYHHLDTLHRAGIPTFLVSAIFRPDQPFFRWYGSAWRHMLRCFKHVFVQDEPSLRLLSDLGLGSVSVAGDTRFDRVVRIAREGATVPLAKAFHEADPRPVLIAGSTWSTDEDLIAKALKGMRTTPRSLVVPHEPTGTAVERVMDLMPAPIVRWTRAEAGPHGNMQDVQRANTLVMDRTGLLARTYQHADMAYVGGGFGEGIHSLLEAAAWGVPVLFGPRHTKFAEARGLIDAGGGHEVRSETDLRHRLDQWTNDPEARRSAGIAARNYVQAHAGATSRIVPIVLRSLPTRPDHSDERTIASS